MVSFPAWQGTVKINVKESTKDHIYCNEKTLAKNSTFIKTLFGDHVLAFIIIDEFKPSSQKTINCDW